VKITIRKARPEDLKAVNSLTDYMHNYLAKLYGLKLSKSELEEEHLDESDLEQTCVAEDGKRGVVGYISFSKDSNEWAGPHFELEHLVIHEDYQKLGLARKLFEILSNKALQEGVNIETETLTRNKRALTFYKKLGFRPLSISLLLDMQKRILEK
jgi:ribosomal protein S18 acetylase RimI-like enzyme